MRTRSALPGSKALGVAIAAALFAAACAGTAGRDEPATATSPAGEAPAGTAAAEEPGSPSTVELEALYRARTDSARMRFTEADVRFMTGMIAHHAQALVMAGLAPERAASPSIRTLAARIINAQKDEIATMQRWLRERGQPVPEVQVQATTFTLHWSGEHGTAAGAATEHEARGAGAHAAGEDLHDMPGMLTPEQMRELAAATGEEFDRLLLTTMIQHHQGAVTMVHELFATDGAAQDEAAFKLASDIQVDQLTEIARMELMLDEMAAADEGP